MGYFDQQSKRSVVIQNANAVTPTVSGTVISYSQVFNGIEVRYTCQNVRLKEELILSQQARNDLPDPTQYGISPENAYLVMAVEFMLTPANIKVFARRQTGKTPVKQGNVFAFEGDDPIDFEDADSTVHFFFPKDFAWAVNDSATGFANQTSVRRYFYSERGKDYMLVGVPYDWIIGSPSGTLIIAPTTSVATSEDVWLEDATNKNGYNILLLGKAAFYNKKRTIIKFNVAGSGIPPSATVLNARLKMKYYSVFNTNSAPWVDRWVQAHQLLVNWSETQADSIRRLTGTNWALPHGAIDGTAAKATMESTVLFQQDYPKWKYWDLSSLTQKWITGSATNYGVILWATNENTVSTDLRLYSSSAANHDSIRPKLQVTWSTEAKTVYFLKDHLGSIRATVLDSATAPVIGYDDYDPWGYPLAGRTKKTPYDSLQKIAKNKFTGKEWDDDYSLNWNYFGARYYDPQIGRWMVRDPMAEKYPSWSAYVFVLNNPLVNYDPQGKDVIGLHLGLQVGFLLGGGASVQFVYDTEEKRFTVLASWGGGAMLGGSATGEIGVVYSPNTISDIVGSSIEIGADISKGHGVGVAFNPSMIETENIVPQMTPYGPRDVKTKGEVTTGKGSVVVSYSPGLSANVHFFKMKAIDVVKLLKSTFGAKTTETEDPKKDVKEKPENSKTPPDDESQEK